MQLALTIVAFLVIFSVLILVHEFGHFYMAKRNGIKVEEFGFGLPPRIWGKKRGETLYSINWIPFGGFVRMLGENPSDKKAFKSPRSFLKKSLWQRTQVVVAGVMMNFLLAWVLFSVGFGIGMQPLVVDADDFLESIRNGRIDVQHGVYVDEVEQGSWAEENGFKKGDRIETLNGMPIVDLSSFYEVLEKGESYTINGLLFEPTTAESAAGLWFQVFELPRVVVASVDEGSLLRPGDAIYSVDGQTIFTTAELQYMMGSTPDDTLSLQVLRGDTLMSVELILPETHRTVVSQVLTGTPAEEAGLMVGDQVIRVNGREAWTPEQVIEIITTAPDDQVTYEVERNGEILSFTMIRNEEGYVGVMLSPLISSENATFSYYDGIVITSVMEILDVQYVWYKAPGEALKEIYRVSGYTMQMAGSVFGKIFTTGNVPDEVSGPVGIAQMTGFYVEEGLVALMRFTGLLSLSLAVINIFPFPALDGGRLLFIIVELVRGKPLNQKIEGVIHSIGFFLLMIVILMVTFQDIGRLFS